MATVIIKARDGQQVYLPVLRHILENGRLRAPRGDPTLDAGFTVIKLESPRQALPVGLGRDVNRNVAAAEAIQLIGGFAQPDLLTRASPNFARYARDDGTFHGAYGARVKYQVGAAVAKLRRDPQTRQAVITLWDPWLDNLEGEKDYPCTVMLHFEARNAGLNAQTKWTLDMNVVMRSNDAWLGLPYDMFQFGQLQFTVARALGWAVGSYCHTALSLHLYTRDVIAAERIDTGGPPTDFKFQPEGIGRDGDSFTEIMKRARQVVNAGTNGLELHEPTRSELWYVERFASYMGRDVVGGGADDRAAEPVQP